MKRTGATLSYCAVTAIAGLLACGGARIPFPGPHRRVVTEWPVDRAHDIQLVVQLNDTVFSVKDVNATLGRRPVGARHPEVTVCIKNVSGWPYLVPFEQMGVWDCGVTDCAQGVALELGTYDGRLIVPGSTSISALRSRFEDDYFQEIKPGETLCLRQRVGIFQEAFATRVSAGSYWAAFSYQSVVFQDTIPRVWIGSCTCDTLRFRLADD